MTFVAVRSASDHGEAGAIFLRSGGRASALCATPRSWPPCRARPRMRPARAPRRCSTGPGAPTRSTWAPVMSSGSPARADLARENRVNPVRPSRRAIDTRVVELRARGALELLPHRLIDRGLAKGRRGVRGLDDEPHRRDGRGTPGAQRIARAAPRSGAPACRGGPKGE